MIYYAGKLVDELNQCDNEQEKKRINDKLGFFTPILKGFLTEVGFESANQGLQVFGGHGYIKESGLEQIVRDARISTLYEGTTGIQGLDLLGRKVLLQRGKTLKAFSRGNSQFLQETQSDFRKQAQAQNEQVYLAPVQISDQLAAAFAGPCTEGAQE